MDNTVWVAVLVVAGPLLLAALTNWQRRKEKAEDRIQAAKEKAEREAVAVEAKRQADEVAAQAAADRDAAEKRQDEVAGQAAEVARLLLEAQQTNIVGAKPPGGAGTDSWPAQGRVLVSLSHPNGERQEVLLAGVPREGDHIRLNNGRAAPPLIVEYVLWVQGEADPVVVVVVGGSYATSPE